MFKRIGSSSLHQICPSKSPMAPLVFFVKKDSGLRFVQDYCKLNDITVKNASSPNTRIVAAKAKYFTKLDIHWCEGDAADEATIIDYSKTGANKR